VRFRSNLVIVFSHESRYNTNVQNQSREWVTQSVFGAPCKSPAQWLPRKRGSPLASFPSSCRGREYLYILHSYCSLAFLRRTIKRSHRERQASHVIAAVTSYCVVADVKQDYEGVRTIVQTISLESVDRPTHPPSHGGEPRRPIFRLYGARSCGLDHRLIISGGKAPIWWRCGGTIARGMSWNGTN